MNTQVRYALFDTAWGKAAVGWTERGVCKLVLPGPPEDRMIEIVALDYPEARPGAPGEVKDAIEQVGAYFADGLKKFDVPLDLSFATQFRRKVYRALMRVPYGKTVSYAGLAQKAGVPGAARAVGAANANNRVPLIVPCHRVIKSDGGLGGFSAPGGTGLKQRLLAHES